MLDQSSQEKVKDIWDYYLKNKDSIKNASKEYTQEELDQEREKIIPQIRAAIEEFRSDATSLEDFKTRIDGLNKKHRLWGFKGMSGQMYFNMLYNRSEELNTLDELREILSETIAKPKDVDDARSKIKELATFSNRLGEQLEEKSKAPRTGSTNYFLSYFWQVINHDQWPIYYKSMVRVFEEENVWSPSGNLPDDYEDFYNLNFEIQSYLEDQSDAVPNLWEIEHALWIKNQAEDQAESTAENDLGSDSSKLPKSYIPPIISVLPSLASNSEEMKNICDEESIDLSSEFENRLSTLLEMLGFRVEKLGQGAGRVPDGKAISDQFRYALIYDAKVRQDGYSVGTDDRAFKEYIQNAVPELKKKGIRNVYFLIVSSTFNGDFDNVIRDLKINTDISEVLFVEVEALLSILESRLRDPELSLGNNGIQSLFVQSGEVTKEQVKEFLSA